MLVEVHCRCRRLRHIVAFWHGIGRRLWSKTCPIECCLEQRNVKCTEFAFVSAYLSLPAPSGRFSARCSTSTSTIRPTIPFRDGKSFLCSRRRRSVRCARIGVWHVTRAMSMTTAKTGRRLFHVSEWNNDCGMHPSEQHKSMISR